ncbi:hypothetical protein P70_0026 [Listeria phage P70]|uniref:Uncharacterized protein n=1 Tax=Listeria phage P70 TaxID=1225800 RepID=J9QRU8_9CAUD|nr:hypothetical protein P70_0026 [Listeria phage P70]AFQ96215.1 hypothetical protein P70_0026 [Listeria phage P70]
MVKLGSEAKEALFAEKKVTKRVTKFLKQDEGIVLQFAGFEKGYAQAMQHQYYGVWKGSSECTGNDLYDKAVEMIYQEAKEAPTGSDEEKRLKDLAYAIKAKPVFLFGFWEVATGEELILPVSSKKQALALYKALEKHEKKFGKKAFEIERIQGGYLVSPLDLDELDLNNKQVEDFETHVKDGFNVELYDEALWKDNEEAQLEKLAQAGIDIDKLIGSGHGKTATPAPAGTEPLPF